ncbi:MAG: type 4a pilus biogenesis protein PilO [Candidatus Omnitrophica bacterium]|nr:type 4a pilus biogenesis protein PilO [Candidatus Omnitrophota bacterium]
MKLKRSEQILLAATLLVGAIFLFQKYGSALTGTESGTSPSEVKSEAETETRKLSKAKSDLGKVSKKLNVGKFRLPPTTESPEVYLHIRETAEKCGLGFSEFPSTPPQKGKGFQTIGYQFKATAELKNLVKFVDQIQSGVYLICLENWSLKPADDPKNVEANLSVVAYFQPAGGK